MDFSRDYSWSGVNYVHGPGLPTIASTPTAVPVARGRPSDLPRFAVTQNRDFGNRWYHKRAMHMCKNTTFNGPQPDIEDYNPNSTSFPLRRMAPKQPAPKIARPGYYNALEADLYSYLPRWRAGFYPYKEAGPQRPTTVFAQTASATDPGYYYSVNAPRRPSTQRF